jgi:hypothetical protein
MDILMFLAVYFAGFFTAVNIFGTLIYWKEISDWLSDIKDRIHCQWILWKYK